MGYSDTPHNCQVYLPCHRMIIVCRDVKLDEEKAMRYSLEIKIQLHAYDEILAPNEEPRDDVEQPHAEE